MEYKGYGIKVSSDGMFQCGELSLETDTYKKMAAQIDKARKKAKLNLAALRVQWYGGIEPKIEEVVITSRKLATGSFDKDTFWINLNGKREQARLKDLYENTPEVRAQMAQSFALSKQADEMNDRAVALLRALPHPIAAPEPNDEAATETGVGR